MTDTFEQTVHPEEERNLHTDTATTPEVSEIPGEQPSTQTDAHDEPTWRIEAGRKGAKRIHQLIEAGKRYEEEHGLKSGRQRLRQLIELGKLYEEEHHLRPAGRKRRGQRLSKAERDEVVATLVQCLIRIAKPSFRAELTRLAETLGSVEKGQAA
jgi:hypothetical protein